MWITGLDALRKPLLHLHTQLNAALPWASIDMDFMNLNQAAHGDREFALRRRPGSGWPARPSRGTRATRSWCGASTAGSAPPRAATTSTACALARFGDNMRDVAVTEGDKVEAELRFGVSVNTYGVNDLVDAGRRRAPTPTSTRWWPSTPTPTAWRPSCRGAASGTRRCATPPGSRPGCARFLTRRRVRRLHHQLPGPRRPAPAPRPGRAAADGRRLRLRRRGRLEDRGAAGRGQGDGRRHAAARHLVHGGLHLPLRPGRAEDPRRAHAGGLPEHRRGHPDVRDPPAGHRRTRGPGAAGVRRRPGPGHRDRHRRPGRPVPAGGQRDRGRPAGRAAAEAARRPRGVEARAVAVDLGRAVAHRGRPAPHRAHRRRRARDAARLRRR